MVSVVKREEFEDRAATVADVVMETPGAAIQTMGGWVITARFLSAARIPSRFRSISTACF